MPDMMPMRPSASIFPSRTPVTTLEKAKVLDSGSPTAITKKSKSVAKSPLSAKSVVKNYAATRPDVFRQMSTSSISSLRPYAQSRGYLARSANNSVHAPTTVTPPGPSVGIPTSTFSTKATIPAIGNQANASLIAKQIAPWATLIKGLSFVKEKPAHISFPSPSLRIKNATTAAQNPAGMGIFSTWS